MHGTPSTIHRQAGTALLAVIQHITDHELGTPVSIVTPTVWEPHVSLFVASTDLDRWLDPETSGFIVEDSQTMKIAGLIAGRRAERMIIAGRLETLGIRVRLTAVRTATRLTSVTDPAPVTA